MRQAELDGSASGGEAGRERRAIFLDPRERSIVTCGDGASATFRLEGGKVILNRGLAAMSATLRVSVEHYAGVTLARSGAGHAVRLVHAQAGLTVQFAPGACLAETIAQRDALARSLGLPVLEGVEPAPLASAEPANRRAGPRLTVRPRFLRRREKGAPVRLEAITMREIIARA